jgi:hypothetical protein
MAVLQCSCLGRGRPNHEIPFFESSSCCDQFPSDWSVSHSHNSIKSCVVNNRINSPFVHRTATVAFVQKHNHWFELIVFNMNMKWYSLNVSHTIDIFFCSLNPSNIVQQVRISDGERKVNWASEEHWE